MDWSQLINWFKISNTHLFAIVIGCSILFFAPDTFIKKLGLTSIRDSYQLVISVLFLIAISILGARGCVAIIQWIKKRITWRKNLEKIQKRLHHLTPGEKKILRDYIYGNTRTQNLLIQDGVAQGLALEKIIYRTASVGDMLDGFAFNIQPWAWEYLNKNKKLLEW